MRPRGPVQVDKGGATCPRRPATRPPAVFLSGGGGGGGAPAPAPPHPSQPNRTTPTSAAQRQHGHRGRTGSTRPTKQPRATSPLWARLSATACVQSPRSDVTRAGSQGSMPCGPAGTTDQKGSFFFRVERKKGSSSYAQRREASAREQREISLSFFLSLLVFFYTPPPGEWENSRSPP
jgi:hypothetical protein